MPPAGALLRLTTREIIAVISGVPLINGKWTFPGLSKANQPAARGAGNSTAETSVPLRTREWDSAGPLCLLPFSPAVCAVLCVAGEAGSEKIIETERCRRISAGRTGVRRRPRITGVDRRRLYEISYFWCQAVWAVVPEGAPG